MAKNKQGTLGLKSVKYYACFVPRTGRQLITKIWADCASLIKGQSGARYKSFKTKNEAEAWLAAGAVYGPSRAERKEKLAKGIYFDAGTGRGEGVEISVTDERGKNLLHKAFSREELNKHGKRLLDDPEATNNYGELLACRYALQIAISNDIKQVFGDSKLVIDYWSRGYIKKKEVAMATVKLAEEVMKSRNAFELSGGALSRVSGDVNPADLGFHR